MGKLRSDVSVFCLNSLSQQLEHEKHFEKNNFKPPKWFKSGIKYEKMSVKLFTFRMGLKEYIKANHISDVSTLLYPKLDHRHNTVIYS